MKKVVAISVLGLGIVNVAFVAYLMRFSDDTPDVAVAPSVPEQVVTGDVEPAPEQDLTEEVLAKDEIVLAPATPEPEPLAEPEPEPPAFTVAMIEDMRAVALQHRVENADALIAQEIASHQRRVDWALRPASDTLFDAAHTDQAATARTACSAGETEGCVTLAKLYATGTGTLEDGPLAFSLNFLACQDGSDDACLAISDHQSFETNEGIVGPHVAHFERRCADGLAKACEKLALYTLYGFHNGVAKDETRSQDLSDQACALGSAQSCMTIGDTAQGIALFQSACDAGDMGDCVQAGRALRASDPSAAHAMFQAACDAAPDQHCRSYGAMISGEDPDKSLALYRQGCTAGDLFSCRSVVKRVAETGGDPIEARAAYAQACAADISNESFCRETMQAGLSGLDLWDREVATVIGQIDDVTDLSASCAAGDSAGCLALAKAHARLGSSKSAYVIRGLNERACTLGDKTACTSAIAQLSTRTAALGETLCAEGMDAACVQLIWIDRGVDGAERFADLSARCENGSAAACGYVGSVLVNGGDRLNTVVALDLEQGARLLQRGCDGANAQACVELGRLKDPDIVWREWEGVAKDEPLAVTLYEKACDQGLAYGCSMHRYASDRTGDIETAMIYAIKSCEYGACQDVPRLQLYLERRALDAEHGVLAAALMDRPQDFQPFMQGAARRARAGCLADITDACVDFGVHIYQSYAGGGRAAVAHEAADRDWARAAWLKACEMDNRTACAMFAESHDGIGAESQPAVSLTYHTKACDMGLRSSCGRAAYYYESGYGTAEDAMIAADHYGKACDLGSAYDCERLGGMYDILDTDPVQFVRNQIQACVSGDTYRCSSVASDFEAGAFDLPKSPEIAAVLKRIGCEDDPECTLP